MRQLSGLGAALMVGAILRLVVVLVMRTYAGDPGAYEHAEIATHLAQGDGFSFSFFSDHPIPSSHQAPAQPALLALCFLVAGTGAATAYLLMELLNVVFSVVAAYAAARIAQRMWDAKTGVTAAWLFAVYPALLYAVTRVQAVNWAMTFFLLAVLWVMRATEKPSWRGAAITGLVLGLGVLGDPILLACAATAILAMAILRQCRSAVMVAAVLGIVLAPWVARNFVVHGKLVPLKSTFWYVFWEGNNLQASGTDKMPVRPETRRLLEWRWSIRGMEESLAQARREAVSIDQTIPPAAEAEIREVPREIDKMEWFRRESLDVLRNHPGHYLRMCAVRLGQLAWFDPTNPRAFAPAFSRFIFPPVQHRQGDQHLARVVPICSHRSLMEITLLPPQLSNLCTMKHTNP